jgi:hypothetical protein
MARPVGDLDIPYQTNRSKQNKKRSRMALMILPLLRGVSKVMAGVSGLLLVYGITYAMEGMTTRLPETPIHELAVTTLWLLPWTLLLCSGFEDFGKAIRQDWVSWLGMTLVLAFLYYFERNTRSAALTKAAMPLLAATGACCLTLSAALGLCSLFAHLWRGSLVLPSFTSSSRCF